MADIDPAYQPPPPTGAGPLGAPAAIREPRTVGAGRGLTWLAEGWALFLRAPLIWIAVSVIAIIVFMALAFVPVVGQLGTTLLSVLFAGGLMIGCRRLDRGGELTVGHLFAGFQSHLSPLLVIGALYIAALFLLLLVLFLVGGGAAFAIVWGEGGAGDAFGAALMTFLVAALVLVPLTMAIWFAPGLVTLHDVQPVEAMKLSFRACIRNILPFLVYGVFLLILAILASIPFGLGWLIVLPMVAGSVYAGYKDIFLPG
jgi:uncharacterized membrane protein